LYSILSRATLIIPAAGSGSRLKKELPKPYLEIAGRTILEHTLSRFSGIEMLGHIVVPTSPEFKKQANDILEEFVPEGVTFDVIAGGQERQHSIFNALNFVTESELVIVHDAVRPFVSVEHIVKCCEEALDHGAAILGVPAKDTIKKLDHKNMVESTPTRKFLWQAQTPQVFRTHVIKEAYEKAFEDHFIGTDDASLVERLGKPVKMVRGDRSNFKITYPLDLELAELLLGSEENE
jgi:2-C-methyl-D-erythritol 4-phosphate cytidylyltransferase